MKKPLVYSHTILESFEYCFGMGMHQLRQEHRFGSAGPALQGQAGHAVLEMYLRHLKANDTSWDKEKGAEIIQEVCARLNPEDASGIRPFLERMIEDDFSFIVDDMPAAANFEVRSFIGLDGVTSDDSVDVVYGYTPDLWYVKGDTLSVWDWKFGMVPEHVHPPDMNRQLRRYASAILHEGTKPSNPSADRIRSAELHIFHARWGYHEMATISRQQMIEDFAVLVHGAVRRVERTKNESPTYGLVTGGHCATCDARAACPAYWSARPPEESTDNMELSEAVAAYATNKARVSDMETSIRSRMERTATESVEHCAFTAKIAKRESISFQPRKTMEYLTEKYLTEEQAWNAMACSKSSVEKALSMAKLKPGIRGGVLDELEKACGTKKVTAAFTVSRTRKKREVEHGTDDVDADSL